MNTYEIAELTTNIEIKGKTLARQGKIYLTSKSETADIIVALADEFIRSKQKETPNLTMDECEYIWTSIKFYYKLLDFNGFMLHASAVAVDNKAYLFSAESGTGKSTHTWLWQRYFGENRAVIINDDKPAIRLINNKFYAYGTPWSGKSDKNLNVKIPLQSIIFIERSQENWIDRIDSKEAIRLVLQQTIRPRNIEKMDLLLVLLDKLLKVVPIYKMGCDISEDAVRLAYNTLNNVKCDMNENERRKGRYEDIK